MEHLFLKERLDDIINTRKVKIITIFLPTIELPENVFHSCRSPFFLCWFGSGSSVVCQYGSWSRGLMTKNFKIYRWKKIHCSLKNWNIFTPRHTRRTFSHRRSLQPSKETSSSTKQYNSWLFVGFFYPPDPDSDSADKKPCRSKLIRIHNTDSFNNTAESHKIKRILLLVFDIYFLLFCIVYRKLS
jgi:hypothetical protein